MQSGLLGGPLQWLVSNVSAEVVVQEFLSRGMVGEGFLIGRGFYLLTLDASPFLTAHTNSIRPLLS